MSDPGALTFALDGVWPNPSSGHNLTVRFMLSEASAARWESMDVAGRSVAAREVGELGPGMHDVHLGGLAHIRPGLYFVRLVQGANEKVTRVTIL